ncbi:MAG: hypothetical protein IJH37_06485 [Clostridia bacterium]|nr:hypothetical protein [Clostridia bacterium]
MTYGNLALKCEYSEEEQARKSRDNKAKQNREKKTQNKAVFSFAGKVASVVVVSVCAIFMIVQFIKVNESQSALYAAREKFRFEEAVTAQKSFELEQSIDLSKIEQEATSRLGMRLPEKHQVVYIDVQKDDMTEKTADEVEGVTNRFVSGLKYIISHIVDFFSI